MGPLLPQHRRRAAASLQTPPSVRGLGPADPQTSSVRRAALYRKALGRRALRRGSPVGCVGVRREESPLLQAAKTDSERFPGMCAAAVEGGGIDPGLPGRGPGRGRSRGAVLCQERNDTFAEPSRQRLPWRARHGAERQRAAAAGAELGLRRGQKWPCSPRASGCRPAPSRGWLFLHESCQAQARGHFPALFVQLRG